MLSYDSADVVAILRSIRTPSPDARVDEVIDAFVRAWRRYGLRAYPILVEVIDDVIQDVLMRVTDPDKLAQLGDPDRVERWANSIFVNRCLDYVRDRRARAERHADLSDDDDEHEEVLRTRLPSQAPDPEELVLRQRRMAILRRAIEDAPMARMKFIEGRSDEEIALALGKSKDAVSSWIKRFRKSLSRELAGDDAE